MESKHINNPWPLAPDIHTPNKYNTAENDVQNVTDNSITNNTNNTSEMERSKKSRKVSHNATTPYFANRPQQQKQNRLFFNNHPGNDMRYKKVLPGNTSIVALHNQVKRPIFLVLAWSVMLEQKNSTINSEVLLHVFETLKVPP